MSTTERNRRRRHNRKQVSKDYIKLLKERGECLICFAKDNLTFHHRRPKNKLDSVTNLANGFYGITKVKKEIKKCDLLCRDCHDLVHKMGLSSYARFKRFFGIKP